MLRCIGKWILVGMGAIFLMSCVAAGASNLTAAQIVEKNVQARGGLKTWQDINTMVWVGHIISQQAPARNLPFVLEMKKPGKTRFEIRAHGQVAIRIYNGTQGWKLRPGRNGVPDVQSYTKYEVRYAQDAEGIGGPLIDYLAKGVSVKQAGVEELNGRKAYRLTVKLPSGTIRHMWIDAKNFLTLKYEREARNRFGLTGKVSVYYSNYRSFHGIKLPLQIETGKDKSQNRDTMVIDRVVINPRLPDWVFSKPLVPPHQPSVSIGGQAIPLQRHR